MCDRIGGFVTFSQLHAIRACDDTWINDMIQDSFDSNGHHLEEQP